MKPKHLILTLLTLLISITASAYDACINGIYYNFSGTTASVTCPNSNYNRYRGNISIPASLTYKGVNYSVTAIGSSAFYQSTDLKSIELPQTITTIGSNAFGNCSKLTSIKLPQSIQTIKSNAFTGCTKLEKAEFASIEHILRIDFQTANANPLSMAHNLYIDGKQINNIVIPEDSTDIKRYAFAGCSLNTLIMSANVKTIGTSAFTGSSIKKVIWLPEVLPSGYPSCAIGLVNYYSSSNYSSIAQDNPNFYYYPLLTSRFEVNGVIYVPLSTAECDVIDCNYNSNPVSPIIGPTITYMTRILNVRDVMPYACYNDTCLSGKLTVSNQGYIGKYAFSGCNQVTSAEISNDGTIEEHAFSYCTKLEDLSVSNNGYIGQYAFYGSKITQTANIANKGLIDSYAFSTISGDASFVINNTGSLGNSAFRQSNLTSATITNKVTSIGEYCFAYGSIKREAIINNIGNIADNAFMSITGGSIGFTATINNRGSLGSYAFSKSQMFSVSITSNVTSIGSYCFAGGNIGYRVTIENKGDIGIWAFSSITGGFGANIRNSGPLPLSCFQNSKMGVVDIGDNVTLLGDSCFKSTTFTQATIGNQVNSIGKYSFAGATGFTNIILPNSVKTMGAYSFKGCTTMESITLSRGLNEIKNGVFSHCSSLASLFVPNTIAAIRDNVFDYCSSLKTLTLEDKNGEYILGTSGSDPLFKTCGLDSVYVGGRLIYEVEQSPYSPFMSHKKLRAIRFTDIKQEIYPKEFQDCTNLQNVYMGATMNPIGDYAFSGCTALAHFNVGPAVKRLGSYSFEECSSLQYIDLANTDSLCNNAFMNCTSLPEISIPASTILIQNQVFKGCTALRNLYIKDRTRSLRLGYNGYRTSYKGITGAGTPIFSDCPLDSVYIGGPITYSSTTESGFSPFFYNESLRSVFITNKEETVYKNEFYNCLGLQSVILGPGVTNIEQFGFQSCKSLLYFEFASTLQTIGANAFSDCTNMKTIISHASNPPACGEQALGDINIWTCHVYVPEGAIDAYMVADQWKNFFIESLVEETTGDIDGDGEVDVADIQHIINMIVGTEDSTSAADLNGDGDVDIADIQAIINIIISNANASVKAMMPKRNQKEMPNEDYVTYEQANNTIDVSLNNDFTYSAFQMKVTLPKDVNITAVDFSNARMGDLSKFVKKVTDGQYIIMGYSLDGSSIEGSENVILTIHTSKPAQEDIAITDVVFSTPNAVAYKLPVVGGQATGVKDIVTSSMKVVGNTVFIYNAESDTLLYIYSLNGSLVNRQALHHGVNAFVLPRGQYVINKQKVFIGK